MGCDSASGARTAATLPGGIRNPRRMAVTRTGHGANARESDRASAWGCNDPPTRKYFTRPHCFTDYEIFTKARRACLKM